VSTDDNQLAFGAFQEVGPGNHFFGSAHTLANYESAYWDSDTADNETFEKWSENGGLDAAQRANRRWKKVLAEYEPPPLDPAIDEELQAFIDRRKASMADAWY
jgi:trimethylamine--corrinoid protein Co-methyltransferase